MNEDPLHPHLLDILKSPASSGLILAGGYGLQLKREHIRGQRTLMEFIPEVRSTLDLDFFLRLEIFVNPEEARDIRALLDSLGYEPTAEHFLFKKPLGDNYPDKVAKVDLLAREPSSEQGIKVKPPRVGSKASVGLHGRYTPEAFAVEESTTRILVNKSPDLYVDVPHPFPWIVMKTVAAGDWMNHRGTEKEKPGSNKHPFDVYVLTSMITEEELESCQTFNEKYGSQDKMREARELGYALFGTPDSPGFLEVCRQADRKLEFDLFWEGYQTVMGLTQT